MKHFSALIALGICISPVSAFAAKSPPPEPTEHPDWSDAARRGLDALTRTLFDPTSAQVEWRSGFRWGYLKPIIGRRSHGWVACGNVNAKNRMGGYVGIQGFTLFVEPSGDVTVAFQGEMLSSCDDMKHAPINNELLAALPKEQGSGALSVADELKKLAALRDDGIITQQEFEAQKAKLLSR